MCQTWWRHCPCWSRALRCTRTALGQTRVFLHARTHATLCFTQVPARWCYCSAHHSAVLSGVRVGAVARRSSKRGHVPTVALVNVDFGPGTVLGLLLIGSGVALYQVRTVRPEVSRDYDVFFSSLGLLCGGILVFQGWRLDPLLFFGQMMTAGTAISFAVEAVRLRSEVEQVKEEGAPPPGTRPRSRRGGRAAGDAPPRPGLPSSEDGGSTYFGDAVGGASWTSRSQQAWPRGQQGDDDQGTWDTSARAPRRRGGANTSWRGQVSPGGRSSPDDAYDWPVPPARPEDGNGRGPPVSSPGDESDERD